jgi:hypothetical protein
MIVDVGVLADELEQLLRAKDYERVLLKIANFATGLHNELLVGLSRNPETTNTALFVPVLDSLIHRVGQALSTASPTRPAKRTESNFVLHVATELYPVGGHTRVVADVIRALPERRHCVVITDMFGNYSAGKYSVADVDQIFAGTETGFVVLNVGSGVDKVRQLIGILAAGDPMACFMYAHHGDVVANAAVTESTCRRSIFVHHADHMPSLGPTRADYLHLDLSPVCHRQCLAIAGNAPIFLGLTAEDRGVKPLVERERSKMSAACSGPMHKFWPDPPGVRYADVVREVMRSAGGKYYHIGGMPPDALAQIQRELATAGVDPARFVDMGGVRSVWDTFLQLEIDFYVDSLRLGRVKTIVEALGAGLPIVMPAPPDPPSLLYSDMTMGAAVTWRLPEDIPKVVEMIQRDQRGFAARSRQIFDEYYSQTKFAEKVRNVSRGKHL